MRKLLFIRYKQYKHSISRMIFSHFIRVYSKIRVDNLSQYRYFHITQTLSQTMSALLRLFPCLSLTTNWWVKYMVIFDIGRTFWKSSKISTHSVYTIGPFPYLNPQHHIKYNVAENKNPIHLPWFSEMAKWDWNGVKW